VAGEGQEALFSALSGEIKTRRGKAITLSDKPIGTLGPTARRRLGIAFAPEQRLGHAAVGDFPLSENLRITRHGLRNDGPSLKTLATKIRDSFDVRAASGDPKAATLSGGNLQKFVMGREIEREPEVFVVAQPTWGVDAGAASFIRNELMRMTEKGAAVIVISQDLEEIFQIADRAVVLHRGELSDTFHIDTLTPEKIGLLMSGSDIDELDTPEPPPEPRPQPTLVASNVAKTERPVAPPEVPQKPMATMAAVVTQEAAASPPPPQKPDQMSTSGTTSVQWTPPETFHPVGRVQ
jgi:simple sugar transport system ATP-binding protein